MNRKWLVFVKRFGVFLACALLFLYSWSWMEKSDAEWFSQSHHYVGYFQPPPSESADVPMMMLAIVGGVSGLLSIGAFIDAVLSRKR